MFPYYIVRFKRSSNRILPFYIFCFHTTQYDLNFPVCSSQPSLYVRFPYYIVRFKQISSCSIYYIEFKFPYYIVRFKLFSFSWQPLHEKGFHTTQYDLNLVVRFFLVIYFLRFPYYIVRFKQMQGEANIETLPQFPYYIVRFKLSHTQNADYIEKQFPYYIVRFKPNIWMNDQKTEHSFHTTQYDLNSSLISA